MSLPQYTIGTGELPQTRTAGSKRKRTAHDPVEEDIAWTAARCQRLLRTITSRISSLRRLLETDSTLKRSSSGTSSSQTRRQPPKKTEHWSSVDPAWLPNGKPKDQGRTYAAKPKSAARKALKTRDPNLTFPSPFVKRIGSAGFSKDDGLQDSPATGPEKQSRRSRQLPIKPQSAKHELENGLVAAVSGLLSGTRAVAQVRRGPRSLMSTCLRQIPGYIELSADDLESGTNEEDVVTEVLTYLEDFGTKDGWLGLREVVRRQGIHLVAKAIEDNILSDRCICTMIDTCSAQVAITEGQDLLRAWLHRDDVASKESLERFDSFSAKHRCAGFKYRVINELGCSQSSILIRYGNMTGFWTDMLSSLTTDDWHEATQCLISCLSTYAALHSEGELKPSIRSHARDLALKITVMATASLLAGELSSSGIALCNGLLAVAAQTSLRGTRVARQRSSLKGHFSEFETLFLLGSQLILGLDADHQVACGVFNLHRLAESPDMWNGDPIKPRQHTERRMCQEDFASEITKGIVTLEKYTGTAITNDLLEGALSAIERESPAASLLKQVALEVANILRQNDDGPLDFDLEDYLKRLNQSAGQASNTQTPYRRSKGARLRWEEGLCEWVTATPFARGDAQEEQNVSLPEISDDGLESTSGPECSPDVLALSPPLKRRRVQVKSPLWSRKVIKGVVVVPPSKRSSTKSFRPVHVVEDESGDELCL